VSVIRGRPPTASEELLIKAADSLGPDKSVANVEAAAKLVLGNVALVAAILTGFGLFTDVTTRLREAPELLTFAMFCTIASIVFALVALVPLSGRVDVDDLESIRRRFRDVLRWRVWFVGAAATFLLIALFVASRGIHAYVAASGPTEPNIVISRSSAVNENAPAIAATVTQSRAPSGASAELVIRDAAGVIVHRATQMVGSAGEVKLEAAVAKSGSGALSLLYTLTDDRELTRRQVTLDDGAPVAPTEPTVSISRSNTPGEPLPTIAASATQLRAPSGSRAELIIRNAAGVILHRARLVVGSSGEVKLDAAVAKGESGALTLVYTLTSDRELTRREITLNE
jgi:hypothetical protein